jgi:hypothetical protein
MERDDAEKISILMMQINSLLDQSVAFVRDKGSEPEFSDYRLKAAHVMGGVIDILNELYVTHPDLKPSQVGGLYTVAPSIFANRFY